MLSPIEDGYFHTNKFNLDNETNNTIQILQGYEKLITYIMTLSGEDRVGSQDYAKMT